MNKAKYIDKKWRNNVFRIISKYESEYIVDFLKSYNNWEHLPTKKTSATSFCREMEN